MSILKVWDGSAWVIVSNTGEKSVLIGHTGDSSIHFTEASINHANISNIGSNSHAAIDSHIADFDNPHSVTAAQIGAATTGALDYLSGLFTGHTGNLNNPHETSSSSSSSDLINTYKIANYTIINTDDIIIFSGSNLTGTLPNVEMSTGKTFWIKNRHGSILTVTGDAPIDDTLALSLEQHQSVTLTNANLFWNII